MAWETDVINLDDALSRIMGRKDLYKGWLEAFFSDEALNTIAQAFKDRDYVVAENSLHKLKGTAANLSVTKVTELATILNRRAKERDDFKELSGDFKKLQKEFSRAKKMYEDNVDDLMSYGEIII